ncbi:MAG: flippase, partial [Bacteroidetes bacterium HGW-Bacteroidetes-12]
MSNESLSKTAAKSFFWVAIDVLGQRLLQFIIGIILARILLPQEFGLIGLISIFLAFSMVFIESGFSFALIRKKEIEDIEYTTVFWFNLGTSIVFYVILFLSSTLIAKFYDQDILINIIKLVGLNLIINAIGSTQNVRLRKELRFKEITIIGFFSKIISGSIALYMAFNGYGVWSLVAQQLILNSVKVILMIYINWFLPSLNFSISHFKSLFSFSY